MVGTRVEPLAAPPPRPPEPCGEPEPDVALIKIYPGIDPVLLTTAVDAGARGLAPGKARCALMVALGPTGGVRAARDWFARL